MGYNEKNIPLKTKNFDHSDRLLLIRYALHISTIKTRKSKFANYFEHIKT